MRFPIHVSHSVSVSDQLSLGVGVGSCAGADGVTAGAAAGAAGGEAPGVRLVRSVAEFQFRAVIVAKMMTLRLVITIPDHITRRRPRSQ